MVGLRSEAAGRAAGNRRSYPGSGGRTPGLPPAELHDHDRAPTGAVGLIIDIDMTRTEVVGVMPPAFVFPGPTALWRPLPIDRETT